MPVTAIVVSGCGADGPDVYAPAIESARSAAQTDVRDVLGSIDTAGRERGRGRADGCSAGQDAFTVSDPYEFICRMGEAVVVGLGSPGDPSAALRLADDALAGTCPAGQAERLADDVDGLNALRSGSDAAVVRWFSCGPVSVEARVLRAVSNRSAQELSRLPTAASEQIVEADPLDGPASIRRAAESGDDYVLAVHVTTLYYEAPRG